MITISRPSKICTYILRLRKLTSKSNFLPIVTNLGPESRMDNVEVFQVLLIPVTKIFQPYCRYSSKRSVIRAEFVYSQKQRKLLLKGNISDDTIFLDSKRYSLFEKFASIQTSFSG